MRFLQIHLSMHRGGAHSSVQNIKRGLESIGHQCDISAERPDRLTSLDYDLILFHSFSPDNENVYLRFLEFCREKDLPRTFVMHDYWPMCHQTNMVMIGRGMERCDLHCDVKKCGWTGRKQPHIKDLENEHVVCFTERSAEIFFDHGFSKVHIIPHGIDMKMFHPMNHLRSSFSVLFTNAWGRKEIKGYRHWDWIRKNSSKEIVCREIVGQSRMDDMPGIYSSSDATLFLSLWDETFGLTVIESLACGTPVISYPVGISPSVIEDGVNGFIAPDSNPKTALSMIDDIHNMSEQEMLRMRNNCRKSVEDRFSLQRNAIEYENLARIIGDSR